jgi:hypothetical protein
MSVVEDILLEVTRDATLDLKTTLARLIEDPTSLYYTRQTQAAMSLYFEMQVKLVLPGVGGRTWHRTFAYTAGCTLETYQHLAFQMYHGKLERELLFELNLPVPLVKLVWAFAASPHFSVHSVWEYRPPPEGSAKDPQQEEMAAHGCFDHVPYKVVPGESPPLHHVKTPAFMQDCCSPICRSLCERAERMYT